MSDPSLRVRTWLLALMLAGPVVAWSASSLPVTPPPKPGEQVLQLEPKMPERGGEPQLAPGVARQAKVYRTLKDAQHDGLDPLHRRAQAKDSGTHDSPNSARFAFDAGMLFWLAPLAGLAVAAWIARRRFSKA